MKLQFPLGFNQEFQKTRNAQIPECDLGANVMSFLDAQEISFKAKTWSAEEMLSIVKKDAALAQSVEILEKSFAYAAVQLGFLVWNLNQPDAQHIDLVQSITDWIQSSMGIENSTTRGPLSVFVLEQTLSLAPHIPTNVRSEFMREVFNKVESNYKPWGRTHFGSNEMRGYLLGLMGEAAIASGSLSYKEDPARKVYCALDYWRLNARRMLGGRWQGNQQELAAAFIQTQFPKNHMRDFFMTTEAEIWIFPAVHLVLAPLLDDDDELRFKLLPWSENMPQKVNQTMVQLYCPSIYALLDLATTSEDWESKSSIEAFITVWHTKPENDHLEIPLGFNASI